MATIKKDDEEEGAGPREHFYDPGQNCGYDVRFILLSSDAL